MSVSDHQPPQTPAKLVESSPQLPKNSNNNNNRAISRFSDDKIEHQFVDLKTRVVGFSESVNTSDYEEDGEDDAMPETIIEENETNGEIADSDENLEIRIIPDNCRVIRIDNNNSYNYNNNIKFEEFNDSVNFNFTNNPILRTKQVNYHTSMSDSQINKIQTENNNNNQNSLLNSIKSNIDTKLNDAEILKIIKIYQENQNIMSTEDLPSNNDFTNINNNNLSSSTSLRSRSSQYITPLPGEQNNTLRSNSKRRSSLSSTNSPVTSCHVEME